MLLAGCEGGAAPPAEASAARIERFCASCHALPPVDALPRFAWRDSVRAMYEVAGLDPERPGGETPPADAVAAWYEARAPEALPLVKGGPPLDVDGPFAKATPRELSPRGAPPLPGAADVQLVDLFGDRRPELVVCDARSGAVFYGRPYEPEAPLSLAAKVPVPAHAAVVDLDRDGQRDLVVADLGTLKPEDHARGALVWLRRVEKGGFEARPLVAGLGRVAKVLATDLDADGDADLVAAEFGYRKTGRLLIFENQGGAKGDAPKLALHVLDARHGAVDLSLADVDGDGRRDVVALFAQEHEQVCAYLARGGLAFERRDLWRAPHPAWGSVSLQVVDLDGDGDLDLLLANGDTLDDHMLKPDQGVRWLENVGVAGVPGPDAAIATTFTAASGARALRYAERPLLVPFYGAQCVRAGDLDGDGRLDVVACAFLPRMGADVRGPMDLPSLVWWRQRERGVFEARTLERRRSDHPALALGDVDGDGRLDLAVGTLTMGPPEGKDAATAWVTLRVR